MTQNQRLRDVQDALGFKSQASFARELGIQQGSLSDIYREKKGVGVSGTIKRLLNKRYAVNIEWLEYGTGQMFSNAEQDQEQSDAVVVSDPFASHEPKIPLLPLDAKAGSLNDFVMSVKLQDCERIISPIRNVDFAITVKGDSMAPKIPSKSKVFIKKIDHSRFVEWGEIYVLDTCNGTVIKRIMPTDDAQVIRCVSLNADYPSFDVALVDVYGIYQVLLVMTEL